MVKASDHGWHVTSSRPVPLKTRRVRKPMHVKCVESSNVLPLVWCDMVASRGVSGSSLVRSSKLRGPSPNAAHEYLNSAKLILIHSLTRP
ncbi:hypothetical protein TNCV_870071 [Trichonephila clavipes]|nr:hypothetical protein TNCV_870071 [Trichonephila clavipes]